MIQPYAICQKYYRLEYDDMATIAFSNFYLPPSSHPFIWTLTSPSSSTSGESSQLSMWQYLRRGGAPHLPMLSPSWSMEKYSNYLDTLWSSWLSTNDYPQFSFIFCSLKGCKYVDYFQRISWSGQKHFNYTLGTMSSIKTSWSFLNWNWWLKITDQNSVIIQRSSRLLWEIQWQR